MGRIRRVSGCYRVIAAAVLLWPVAAAVGQIDDPPGPPGSEITRMKSLNEIEPRMIISALPCTLTNRGAYYLTGNLMTTNDTHGIIIATNDITLDLNGFVLGSASTGSFYGISLTSATVTFMNLSIRNGVVRGWRAGGISMPDGINCRLTGITAVENGAGGGNGIYVGRDWEVEDCLAFKNQGPGITIGDYTRVRNCRAKENLNNGFHTGIGSVIEKCVSVGNGGCGFFGQTLSSISECVAIANTNDGIYVGPNSLAVGNVSGQNTGSGITTGGGSRLERNLASNNGGNGIVAGGGSMAKGNQASGNTGAGIVGGADSRIEGNHVSGNGIGLKAETSASRSVFVGNSAVGNGTNYVASPNSSFGQVIDSNQLGTNFFFANPWGNFNMQ